MKVIIAQMTGSQMSYIDSEIILHVKMNENLVCCESDCPAGKTSIDQHQN